MRFAELEHADVAVWGYGREGRGVLGAIRRRYPDKPLTLFCQPDEAADARGLADPHLRIVESAPDASALAAYGFVIKSPGISAYRPEILAARERGTRFTSGTALWFGDNASGTSGGTRVVAVTGTKGKSTTTAMIAHCARALGIRTALAGNIGMPLLDLDGQHADLWAIELSSFQTSEAGPVELGVVVSLAEEHLDWHGTRDRYIADKLKLADVSRTLLVNAGSPLLMHNTARHPRRRTFNEPEGWHVVADAIMCGGLRVLDFASLPLRGAHNAHNVCAALAAIELLGFDACAAAKSLVSFKSLPHRLTSLGVHDGIEWIDDSISTTPDAALAALNSLPGRAVTLILGGHDRGLDWSGFARVLGHSPPHAVVVQGASGPRVVRALRDGKVACPVRDCGDLAAAIMLAKTITPSDGVVLLSPGAPSFDQFRDYTERGRVFADLAGFDGMAIGEVAGLGIA